MVSLPSLSLSSIMYRTDHSRFTSIAGQAGIDASNAEQSGQLLTLPPASTSKPDPNAGKSLMQIKAEKDEEERKKRKADGIDEGKDAERKKRKKEEEEKDAMGVTEKEMGTSLLPRAVALGAKLIMMDCAEKQNRIERTENIGSTIH